MGRHFWQIMFGTRDDLSWGKAFENYKFSNPGILLTKYTFVAVLKSAWIDCEETDNHKFVLRYLVFVPLTLGLSWEACSITSHVIRHICFFKIITKQFLMPRTWTCDETWNREVISHHLWREVWQIMMKCILYGRNCTEWHFWQVW